MNKIVVDKIHMLEMLKVLKQGGCNTIEDVIKMLDNDLIHDTDMVFQWDANEINE